MANPIKSANLITQIRKSGKKRAQNASRKTTRKNKIGVFVGVLARLLDWRRSWHRVCYIGGMSNEANNGGETMNQSEFWSMDHVKAAQDVQKNNPYGSTAHRNAYLVILKAANDCGVSEWFETIEEYDAAI